MPLLHLPALYADALLLDTQSGAVVFNRDPDPGETNVPRTSALAFDVVDTGFTGLDLAALEVRVNGVAVFAGGTVSAGWSGGHTWLAPDLLRVVLTPDEAWDSAEQVAVEADVALVGDTATTWAWQFQVEDATAPRLVNAVAIAQDRVRLVFAQPIAEDSAQAVVAALPWGDTPLAFDPVLQRWATAPGTVGFPYVRGSSTEPFALADGQTLQVAVNGQTATVVFSTYDFANIGAATAAEVAAVMTRDLAPIAGSAYATPDGRVVVRADVYGRQDTVAVQGGTAQAGLGLPTEENTRRMPFGAFAQAVSGPEPYALEEGDTLAVKLNGGDAQTVTLHAGDFDDIAAATAEEVAAVLARELAGGFAQAAGGAVWIFSLEPRATASVQVSGGTAATSLAFPGTVQTTRYAIPTPDSAYPVEATASFSGGNTALRTGSYSLNAELARFVLGHEPDALDLTTALAPGSYTLEAINDALWPTVGGVDYLTVLAVEEVAPSVFDLVLSEPMSAARDAATPNYRVAAPGVVDAFGNVADPDWSSFDFAGFIPPVPAGRRFDMWSMLPLLNRDEDSETREFERFIACLQEVVGLLLYDTDRYPETVDPDRAPASFVDAMLADLGNPFPLVLGDTAKRRLVRSLTDLYALKGTGQGIVAAIRLFFGLDARIRPTLIESWTIGIGQVGIPSAYVGGGLVEGSTVGTSDRYYLYAFDVEVFLQDDAHPERVVLADADRASIRRIVDAMKAAHTHFVALIESPLLPDVVAHLAVGLSDIGGWWASMSSGVEPFALADGQQLIILTESGPATATFHTADFVDITAATAAEVAAVLRSAYAGTAGAYASGGRVYVASANSTEYAAIQATGGTALPALGFGGSSHTATRYAGHWLIHESPR